MNDAIWIAILIAYDSIILNTLL